MDKRVKKSSNERQRKLKNKPTPPILTTAATASPDTPNLAAEPRFDQQG